LEVYSVPAFGNEWYPRNRYLSNTAEYQHHVETYSPQAKFGYKDFFHCKRQKNSILSGGQNYSRLRSASEIRRRPERMKKGAHAKL